MGSSLLQVLLFLATSAATINLDNVCSEGTCPAVITKKDHLLIQLGHGSSKALQKKMAKTTTECLEDPSGSVVSRHGQLSVSGNKVVDASGQPVQLRGMSLFWSQWMPQFWTASTIQWLKNDWHVTLIRAAMGVEMGGYLEQPSSQMTLLEGVIQACIDNGIYVIVDWHDHNADQHLNQAKDFFSRIAEKYGAYPNVLFEVFNEPVNQGWASVIKPYHEAVVSAIRQHSTNVIILGTRSWSQNVDEASQNPVSGSNLAYTIHFYASTHRQELRDKVTTALANGIAIFATEWGTCDASGNGNLDLAESQRWLDFLDQNSISSANWAVADKKESCAALLPGSKGNGGWTDSELTTSGAFVRSFLGKSKQCSQPNSPPSQPISTPSPNSAQTCSRVGEDCRSTGCCADAGFHCYSKNQWFASCRANCVAGSVDPNDPPQWSQPWDCTLIAPRVCSNAGDDCSVTGCCSDVSMTCYRKDQWFAGCRTSCTPGVINSDDPPQFRQPWNCAVVNPLTLVSA